ncbi:MAG: hypothetical protein R3C05_15885 [Pirellulaceae bacterium]
MQISFRFFAAPLFCFVLGCSNQPIAGDADQDPKRTYTQAELDELKADGVSESEIDNMDITVVD